MVRSLVLIAAGFILACCGLWNGFNEKGTSAILGAAVAVLGAASAIGGIVLLCVPHFFSG